jgi:hypothetical protein
MNVLRFRRRLRHLCSVVTVPSILQVGEVSNSIGNLVRYSELREARSLRGSGVS